MEARPWSPSRPAAYDLSKAPGFVLGPLTVNPPMRAIRNAQRSETLEPRVMRVLVALAGEPGRVFSRDDLIDLCWDGQIVGDNAINRVISRLRAVLQALAGDAVKLETITKVGFRLAVSEGVPPVDRAAPIATDHSIAVADPPISRRVAIAGALGAGAVGALIYTGWPSTLRYRPKPEALELYERGMAIQKSAGPGTTRQAMTFYKRAIAIDPEFADGWGALAISYRHGLDGYTREEKLAYPQLLRSAAKRALALDPDQPDANLALVVAYPNYRRWHKLEPQLRRQVQRFPNYWYANAQLGLLLQDVGRIEEAIPFTRRVTEIDPLLPLAWANLGRTYSNAGRDHEADAALDEGFRRWPAHPFLWFSRYAVLMNTRRFAEAALFARDPRTLPDDFPERLPHIYGDLAEGLSTRDSEKVAAGRTYLRQSMFAPGPDAFGSIPRLAPLLAATGAHDDALSAFEAYFLGGSLFGRTLPPPRELDLRASPTLFTPPMLAQRDSRFAALLERIGLEEYWRRSGSQPDFRRN